MLLISNSGLENWEFSTAWSISVWDGIPVAPQPLHFLLYRHFRANTVLEFGQEFSEILVYTTPMSVRLSNVWIATKQKKVLPTFLFHMQDQSS